MGTQKRIGNLKRNSIIAICLLLIGSVFYNVTAFGTDINDKNTSLIT